MCGGFRAEGSSKIQARIEQQSVRSNQPSSQFRAPTKPGAGVKTSPSPSPSKDNPSPEPQLDDIKRGEGPQPEASSMLKGPYSSTSCAADKSLQAITPNLYRIVHQTVFGRAALQPTSWWQPGSWGNPVIKKGLFDSTLGRAGPYGHISPYTFSWQSIVIAPLSWQNKSGLLFILIYRPPLTLVKCYPC